MIARLLAATALAAPLALAAPSASAAEPPLRLTNIHATIDRYDFVTVTAHVVCDFPNDGQDYHETGATITQPGVAQYGTGSFAYCNRDFGADQHPIGDYGRRDRHYHPGPATITRFPVQLCASQFDDTQDCYQWDVPIGGLKVNITRK